MTTETIEREDTALISVPHGQDAFALFSAKDTTGADKLLSVLRSKIDAFKADLPSIDTAAGRKKIASFAYKIAQSKSAIEEVGAALAKDAKDIPRRIDANRKHIKDTLDVWRDEVREPLTDWEDAERDRVSYLRSMLQHIVDCGNGFIGGEPQAFGLLIRELEEKVIVDASWQEYEEEAHRAKVDALAKLKSAHDEHVKREAERAELARLRAEADERARKDREEQIAREAAEKAKRDAEAKAEAERIAAENAVKAEREAAAKREADLKAAAERAEREKAEAVARAERAAQEAKEQAEREARAAKDRAEAEQLRREQDKAHHAKINREALAAFVENGLSEDVAKQVVTLIASRVIPHVQINY